MDAKPRIALVFNEKKDYTEKYAEFDAPSTIAQISAAIIAGGASVTPIAVGEFDYGTLAFNGDFDLIFNIAEGYSGRAREAQYPALYESMRKSYTGSDAYTLTVTQDKWLSKMMAYVRADVPTPTALFVKQGYSKVALNGTRVPFPWIVKPNFEGSSKGITPKSVVNSEREAYKVVDKQLRKYPDGVLVEHFMAHSYDVTVPWVEGLGGALHPVFFCFDGSIYTGKIYDYKAKSKGCLNVRAEPWKVLDTTLLHTRHLTNRLAQEFNLRDVGRIDFRFDVRERRLYFLEVNALPSLERDAGPQGPDVKGAMTVGAEADGHTYEKMIQAIVKTAAKRQRLDLKRYGR